MNLKTKLTNWLRPTSMEWSDRVMFAMRLGIAVLVFVLGIQRGLEPYELDPEKAHGLAKALPLMWLLEPTAFHIGQALATAGLVCFMLGRSPVLTLLPPLLFGTFLGTLRLSKGDTSHSTQIYFMVLLAVWVGYGVAKFRKTDIATAHRWSLRAAILMLAASYFASGIVKLKVTKGQWIARVPNLAVQMVKSNLSDYYSKPTGEISQIFTEKTPAFFAEKPALAKCVFGTGLFLELGGILLVLGRRWALLGGVALVSMHLGISLLMAIEFWGHVGMLTVLCILPGLWPSGKQAEIRTN